MEELAAKHCIPCAGGVPPLPREETDRLLEELGHGWTVVDDHHLAREYRFPDFSSGLALVNRIGEIADAENHHPDVRLSWGSVGIEIWTHSIDGLTESDFILAAKIEKAQAEIATPR